MTSDQSLLLLGLALATTRRWLARLNEPQRHYHTRAHVEAMLANLPPADATREMIAAIWLHDIVYDPKASDNEEMSAKVAQQDLAGSDIAIASVVELILGTKRHEPGSEAQNLLNDLDLGILGAPPPAYARYAHQIRLEYTHVPTPQYHAGRATVLRALDQKQIFQTERFAHLEERAHKNLRSEIARLQ